MKNKRSYLKGKKIKWTRWGAGKDFASVSSRVSVPPIKGSPFFDIKTRKHRRSVL